MGLTNKNQKKSQGHFCSSLGLIQTPQSAGALSELLRSFCFL